MASLFNATNINSSRYFFARQVDGEQQLTIDYPVISGISTTQVGITGAQGNEVQINQMPVVIGTEFVSGEQAVAFGGASTYFTPSTINSNYVGGSLSMDRVSGSGQICMEAYSGNGSLKGFEFLSRGLNSELISTIYTGVNQYISTIGRPGATAVMGGNGTFVTGALQGSVLTSLDFPTGGGGRQCFNIVDISGANPTANLRWSIGTGGIWTDLSNNGSDFNIFSYGDAGQFLNAPLKIRRADAAMAITNISSVANFNGVNSGQVFPCSKTNVEFGAEPSNLVTIAGASNQATPYMMLFSTPLTGLNPNTQTFININWVNALSTGSNHINYKIGFSTATAYTNIVQTAYVPGGNFSPSGTVQAATPLGHTNVACVVDPDGIAADGTATLFIAGQFSDPAAAADTLYIAKNTVSEATRNALVWRPF